MINHIITITKKKAKTIIANTDKIRSLYPLNIFLNVGISDKIALISDYKLVSSGKYFPNQNTESSSVRQKMKNEINLILCTNSVLAPSIA